MFYGTIIADTDADRVHVNFGLGMCAVEHRGGKEVGGEAI